MTILDELAKLEAKADPAPWETRIERSASGLTEKFGLIGKDPYMPGEIDIMYYRHPVENIEFIAAMRNKAKALINVAREARLFRDSGYFSRYRRDKEMDAAIAALEKSP